MPASYHDDLIIAELKRVAKSEEQLRIPSLNKMLTRAREDERARRLERIKRKLARLGQSKNENFSDEDVDESPTQTVNGRV